jgi:hypothetical protein
LKCLVSVQNEGGRIGADSTPIEAIGSGNDLSARKLSRRIVERSADTVGQALHGYDGEQTDQYHEQAVLNEVLSFFFLPQTLHNVHSSLSFSLNL